jgi:hypothetical protein
LPQAPQSVSLLVVSTQAPPQTAMLPEHAQTPSEQFCPVPQTFPHAPQLALSVARVTHRPEHAS